MILLTTDFGTGSPYLAQMRAALRMHGAEDEIIELISDIAPYNIKAAAHLLASQIPYFPTGSIFLCVVDPGVGGDRLPVAIRADGNWFIGPENGLFDVVVARAVETKYFQIQWRPDKLSNTFHGRDLFASIAARISCHKSGAGDLEKRVPPQTETSGDDLHEVIYLDYYGNAITGIRATSVNTDDLFEINGATVAHARTFSDLPTGEPFWYENSVGLVEITVNKGSAAQQLQIEVGTLLLNSRMVMPIS